MLIFFLKKISYDHIHFSIIKMSENLNQEVRTFNKVWKHFDLVSDGKKAKCHYCAWISINIFINNIKLF